jgi:hypothetical protein
MALHARTSRASAGDDEWYCITFANGLFVAVAWNGSEGRVKGELLQIQIKYLSFKEHKSNHPCML